MKRPLSIDIGKESLYNLINVLGPVSITAFSYENGVECLRFWVGVSIENDRNGDI